MSTDPGRKNMTGLSAVLIVLGLLVIALLAVVVFVDQVTVQPEASLTATVEAGTPQPALTTTAGNLEVPASPVVNIDGIAILGGVLVLIVLVAAYREILIFQRSEKKRK